MIVFHWPNDAFTRWPNFTPDEMTCKCGCGALPDPEFMDVLQQIRTALGFSLPVTSAARCPRYNDDVSGTGLTGPHTTGKAVDVKVSGTNAYDLIAMAIEEGIVGIGVSQKGDHASRFIHLDMADSRTKPWIWSY